MKQRILGKDLKVSALGYGCMGLSHAYGAPLDGRESVRLLRRAFELGYTMFDTAEVYGTPDDPHANERLVGEALAPVRSEAVIVSKFGLSFDMESGKVPYPLIPDSRPETIRRSVEGSLRRLRTDHIDLYFQHRPDPKVAPEEVAGVMAELIREGKITHWGISETNENYLRRAHAVCPVTAVENRYSMMARAHESLFPVLEELGVGFVAFSPMANGFLTARYGKGSHFDALRLPRRDAAVHRRGRGEEPRADRNARTHGGGEKRDARADFARVDALQKAVDSADTGNAQRIAHGRERARRGRNALARRGRRDGRGARRHGNVGSLRRHEDARIKQKLFAARLNAPLA